MARILLVEDDAALRDVLALAFDDAGHTLESATDGRDALSRIERAPPDLVVSDVNMPRMDGFALCRKLREAGSTVPFILLTARDGEIDEALGLELGADDYVVKPFSTRVLLARVAALLRREALRTAPRGDGAVAPARTVGSLALDAERLEVRWRARGIVTTLSEFRLLEALTARPGVVFSRERLLEHVRGDDSVVEARIVDTYVRRLRRKLEAQDPGFAQIETVVGAGYRWRDREG